MKYLEKNKLFLLAFLVLIGIFSMNTVTKAETQTPTKILFIGNSQTYYNNMPLMVKGLAKADDMNYEIKSITGPNYKLSQFATPGNAYNVEIVNTLTSDKWDYVVLQEQRENIMQNLDSTKQALTTLKQLIDNAGAKTILYATQGDYMGRDFIIDGTSIYYDNSTLQYYMNKYYYSLGGIFSCQVAPAGLNYSRCMNEYPEINLYNADMIHPSLEGSYLAACTIYQTISGKSAYNNQYLPGSTYDTDHVIKSLDEETAVKLQNISDAVLGLSKYSITLKKGTTSSVSSTLKYSEGNPVMDDYTNSISFSTTNDEIVSINRKTGTITAINYGSAMIMASTDSGLMALCNIDVVQPSTALTITEGLLKLHKKETHTYTTTISPSDTTDKIAWTSSNPSIVSVDEDGKITAKKLGTATITAVTDSGIKLTRSVRVILITPTNVKAVKTSGATKGSKYANIKITWKKNPNAVKYYVYRRRKGETSYKKIATTTSTKYINKNRRKGRTFYYKIVSVYSNTKCNSTRSKFAKIKLN